MSLFFFIFPLYYLIFFKSSLCMLEDLNRPISLTDGGGFSSAKLQGGAVPWGGIQGKALSRYTVLHLVWTKFYFKKWRGKGKNPNICVHILISLFMHEERHIWNYPILLTLITLGKQKETHRRLTFALYTSILFGFLEPACIRFIMFLSRKVFDHSKK